MKLETFDDVITSIEKNKHKRQFHLLLGNGFSMAYDSNIFSYTALHDFVEKTGSTLLTELFDTIKTKNFEEVMRQLENFSALVDVFGTDEKLKAKVKVAEAELKSKLLEAIKNLHPEHVFKVPQEKSDKCAIFLRRFIDAGGSIFTTNYDLLLYWVLMRSLIDHSVDGFGRDRENLDEYVPESELIYSELRWGRNKVKQNIFYLHGALPLFDTGIEIVKEEYDQENFLLTNISNRMSKGSYPIFVTAGDADDKLKHIMHNRYLSNCYEKLSTCTGTLVVFGFNFGDYDSHIIDAINTAAKQSLVNCLRSVYIGVYSDEDKMRIESLASKIKCKLRIFDSRTANIWGQ
jgi:hypothetical protein